MAARILVVEDEHRQYRAVEGLLTEAGYQVRRAEDAPAALRLVGPSKADLVLLDLGLPAAEDGFQVLKQIRALSEVPVVVVTGQSLGPEGTVAALESGANDYVRKDEDPTVLLARIRAALRQSAVATGTAEGALHIGELHIDLDRREATLEGALLALTPTEYSLLKVLAQNRGRVVTHQQILERVWGQGYGDEQHYVRIYVGQLRKKLHDDATRPRFIFSDPGVGYRFAEA